MRALSVAFAGRWRRVRPAGRRRAGGVAGLRRAVRPSLLALGTAAVIALAAPATLRARRLRRPRMRRRTRHVRLAAMATMRALCVAAAVATVAAAAFRRRTRGLTFGAPARRRGGRLAACVRRVLRPAWAAATVPVAAVSSPAVLAPRPDGLEDGRTRRPRRTVLVLAEADGMMPAILVGRVLVADVRVL